MPGSSQCLSVPALTSIAAYAVSGPLIIMVNKMIIKDHEFHAPAFVSSMGCIFTGAITHLLSAVGAISVKPMGDSKREVILPIVTIGVAAAMSMLLGNKAYIFLDPGFLQMMKAATPALLMFALIAFRIEKISFGVSVCALVMVAGSILAALHTPHINLPGILIQGGSQGCEVLQNVMTQVFLQKLAFNALDAGYYIAPTTAFCLLVLSWSLERHVLLTDGGSAVISQIPWLCASGCIGMVVNFSSFFVIQFISSLMAKLVVVARSAALVIYLILVWNEAWTPMQLVGYSITLVAFIGYSTLKAKEGKAKAASKGDDDIEKVQKSDSGSVKDTSSETDQPLLASTPTAAQTA